jgi:hypothetical protein
MARTQTSPESPKRDRIRTESPSKHRTPRDNEVAAGDGRHRGSPSRAAGWGQRLGDLWGSLVQHWPRWLRVRLPRFKLWQLAIIGVVLLVFVLWLTAVAQSTSKYSASVLVTNGRHGIAPPGNPFDFGDLPPTASMDNKLTFKNDGRMDTYIMIGVFGEIRDFIDIEDAFFNLKPGQEREILLKLSVPSTAEPGKRYTGRVVITRLPWGLPW